MWRTEAKTIKGKMEKGEVKLILIGIFSIIAILLLAYNIYSPAASKQIKREDVIQLVESELRSELKEGQPASLDTIYYSYMTLDMLAPRKSLNYTQDTLKYIFGNFYSGNVISNKETSEEDIIRATFMAFDLYNSTGLEIENEFDLGDVLWAGHQRIEETKGKDHRLYFYVANLLGTTGFEVRYTGYYDYLFDSEYCNYKPEENTSLQDLYFASLTLKAENKEELLSGGSYSFTKVERKNPSHCSEMSDPKKRATCLANAETREKEKKCHGGKFYDQVTERIKEASQNANNIQDLEKLFYLYRLRKLYGLKTESVEEIIKDKFYNYQQGGFSLQPEGEDSSARANFYGACVLTDCKDVTAW